jgi:hypothetical protein
MPINPIAGALLGFADPRNVPGLLKANLEERYLEAEEQQLEREQAAAQTANQARRMLFERLDAAGSDPVARAGAISTTLREVFSDPELAQNLMNEAKAVQELVAQGGPSFQALSPGQIPGVTDPNTGMWQQTGPAAPFAPANPSVVIQNVAEKELSIQKARADAQRVYTDIPTLRRDLREQQQNAGAMIQLLEAGTETGQWAGRREARHPRPVRRGRGR